MLPVVDKVYAYVTRGQGDKRELLVFVHRNVPEAGIQVPGGTVEQDEDVDLAVFREVEEEAGLSNLTLVRKLGVYDWLHADQWATHRRHIYHLTSPDPLPDTWVGGEHHSTHEVFDFYWLPLSEPIDLIAGMGHFLDLLR